jgi:hypothetical protein
MVDTDIREIFSPLFDTGAGNNAKLLVKNPRTYRDFQIELIVIKQRNEIFAVR